MVPHDIYFPRTGERTWGFGGGEGYGKVSKIDEKFSPLLRISIFKTKIFYIYLEKHFQNEYKKVLLRIILRVEYGIGACN